MFLKLLAMTPAPPRSCEFLGCSSGTPDGDGNPTPYTTRADNQTRAEVMEDLQSHIKMRHRLPAQIASNSTAMLAEETKRIQAETAKLLAEKGETNTSRNHDSERRFQQKRDAILRPSIKENLSDSDWIFFTAQWKIYTMGFEHERC